MALARGAPGAGSRRSVGVFVKLPSIARQRQRGFLLGLVVLVVALVVIGWTLYRIIKAIQGLPPRQTPPDDAEVAQYRAEAQTRLVADLQAQFPGQTVTVQSMAVAFVPVITADGSNAVLRVESSTNLTTWELYGWLTNGASLIDSQTAPQKFFRAFDANGRPASLKLSP